MPSFLHSMHEAPLKQCAWALCLITVLLGAACAPSGSASLPAGLALEEHALAEAPTFEPLSFDPLQASMQSVLAVHALERSKLVPDASLLLDGHHALRASLGTDVLTATEDYGADGSSGWVALMLGEREIYRIDTGMASPIPALRGLWTYDGHWALETVYITADAALGRLSRDGVQLIPRPGYDEAFEFQLLHGKPFYFFRKGGRIGFSYEDQEVAAGYDEIPHYECCSASALNPVHAEDMLAFFARRGPTWYYVELGIFGK